MCICRVKGFFSGDLSWPVRRSVGRSVSSRVPLLDFHRGRAIFTLPPVRSSELAAACKTRDKLEALLGITKALKPYSRLRRRTAAELHYKTARDISETRT